jgi:hypothetical protein
MTCSRIAYAKEIVIAAVVNIVSVLLDLSQYTVLLKVILLENILSNVGHSDEFYSENFIVRNFILKISF